MEKVKVTTKWLNSLKTGLPKKFADSEQKALQIWIGKNDISFYFVMKHQQKQYHQRIGKYPSMQLQEARNEILNRLGKLANYGTLDTPTPRKLPRVGDAIDALCNSCSNSNTKTNYTAYLRVFNRFRETKIRDLSHQEILKIHQNMADHPVMANHAVKTLATAISKLYKTLQITDQDNPARNIKLYPQFPRKRFLNDTEAPRIIAELEKMTGKPLYSAQAYALLMMIYTGQRKSNVLAMDYSEIVNREMWVIPAAKAKGKSDIAVPLNEYAQKILEKICGNKKFPKSGPVFLYRGKPMKEVRKTMKTVCEICGIKDLHVHDLRRSLGSWMLMNGVDIAVVSRTLGHKSIAVTEKVYAHLLPEKISNATRLAVEAMRTGKV